METLFINIIKSSGLIAMFYIAYYFLLRKETFFAANRWFLLGGLFTSVILPWIVFTTIIWVEPTPTNMDWSKIPVTAAREESFEINWNYVAATAYIIGCVYLILQFAYDFYHLNRTLKGKTTHQQADFKYIDTNENIAPFSYFNTIVYNSSLYSKAEIESILEHEKVHSEQYHTIDVLITRFFCILFWFNPFIWLYKKAILQNLEFIADSEATKNIFDKKVYQLTLLKITTHENCVAITNHFYQSLIKKRIVMLNKNQSKKRNLWKYTLVIPALIAFVFVFQMEVIAQEKTNTKQAIEKKAVITEMVITKNTTDKEIKDQCEKINKSYDLNLTFFNIKRNSKGEIINIDGKISDKTSNGTCNQSDNPIKPFRFYYNATNKETGFDMDMSISKYGVINKKEKSTHYKLPPTIKTTKVAPPPPPALPPTIKKVKVAPPPPPALPPTVKKEKVAPPPPPALPPTVSTAKFKAPELKQQASVPTDKPYFQVNGPVTLPPIIIINGVKTTSISNINEINPDAIKIMNVLKGESAIMKYGESGKYGVIEITTKENASILKESPKKD